MPIKQRQYRLNPKYSLLVKEEIDKLLEAGFIYKVPFSAWISPIVVVPKETANCGFVKIFANEIVSHGKIISPFPLLTLCWTQWQAINDILS